MLLKILNEKESIYSSSWNLGLYLFSKHSKPCQLSLSFPCSLSLCMWQKCSCYLTQEILDHSIVEGEICLRTVGTLKVSGGSHYMTERNLSKLFVFVSILVCKIQWKRIRYDVPTHPFFLQFQESLSSRQLKYLSCILKLVHTDFFFFCGKSFQWLN